jgi:SAM-dependent methyltransferase
LADLSRKNTFPNYKEHYTIDAEEFDYFENRKGATAHEEKRVREYVISGIPSDAKNVLDVGCGRAWVAQTLLAKGITVISLDISIKNPRHALEEYPNKNHFGVTADSYFLPFRDGEFDCVIASEIIEHVPDPGKFLSEIFRVVKSGGRLIITTPYKEIIRYSLCIHCNKKTPINAHLHSFDENKLQSLYTKNDLSFFNWKAFGNKLLIHLRTHVILNYFPFWLWKLKDNFANFIYPKPLHIIAIYNKKSV